MHSHVLDVSKLDRVRAQMLFRRAGFTVIELMVTLGVIAALISILLPAVQAAREAARRAQCVNNLKQIGIAVHAYAQLYTDFPSTMLFSDSFLSPRTGRRQAVVGNCFSPFARILPQMELSGQFNALNFDLLPDFGAGLTANQSVMKITIASYLCPSDSGSNVAGYGRVNYRCNIGPSTFLRAARKPSDSKNLQLDSGPFATGMSLGPADFRDGLSNTIGLSERLQGDWAKDTFRAGGDYRLGDFKGLTVDADQAISTCAVIVKSSVKHESRGGESWCLSGLHFSSYNHITAPNHSETDCGFRNDIQTVHGRHMMDGVFSASSRHSGGVNVLLMGGEVRFVRDAISLAVWRSLGTRAGGEIAVLD